ncbi:LOW QUALITY PROTEIN: protein sevenless [Rhagoletis pomonella]|uniref:LOW QUALITY PROTEIN: protein sevenless n=1 Tax=Rhagoletis pomonella TaxID=28610 RepID=UPI0017854BDD|nr:LOW QUALITY PROTEIN: protein sevenless [Rhagoletis pomonella]
MTRKQLKICAAVGAAATRPHNTRQTSCERANKIFAGVSLTSIMNSFYWQLMLVLVVSCDMCKSNEYPVTSSKAVTATATATDSGEIGGEITIDTTNLLDPYTGGKEEDSIGEYLKSEKEKLLGSNLIRNATIENVTEECRTHCNLQAPEFLNEYGLQCGKKGENRMCFKSRCIKGCEQWRVALANSDTCQETCISTQLHWLDLPCIYACEMGQRHYWDRQKRIAESAIQLERPFIIVSNNTDTLKLLWNIVLPEYLFANYQFSIHIQYQYVMENVTEELQPWRNLANYDCSQNFVCELFDELVPFAVYKFRFKLDLGEFANQALHSPPTEAFRTVAGGVPLSTPVIKEVFALDHSHISIAWQPGVFSCGPITGYVLFLENANSTLKQTLPPDRRSFVFAKLLPSTNYTIKLAMLNAEGEGRSAEAFVQTKYAPLYGNSDNVDLVIVTGEYSVKIKSFESLTDTEVIFESDKLINDYTLYSFLGEQIYFIVDASGVIVRFSINGDTQKFVISSLDKFPEFKPKKISVDWLNKRLFIAAQKLTEQWAVIATDFSGHSQSMIVSNLTEPIEQLDVDPINGWLFWLTSGSLMRTNLYNNYSEPIIKRDVGHFSNTYQSSLITFYNTSDHTLFESTYDGLHIQSLQLKLSISLERIVSFWYNGIHILATNGTHLLRGNYNTNEFDVRTVRELEWCWGILPVIQKGQKIFIQTQPLQKGIPENLNALVTSNMAKISWDAPQLNVYQTEYAWQKWDYELEIMDVASNSAFNIRNIKTTYFNVEKLQSNNLYKFRVRVIFGSTLGAWSKALLTRTWPLGEYTFLLASMNGIYEMNETGTHVEQVGQMENVQDFMQLNATIYYISKDNRLQCVNIMNPEINCSFIATNAMSLAYEWRGGKMYWVDTLGNSVMRANLDGSQRELLPVFGAESIAVDAYNGHIYYSTGVKLMRRSLGDTLDADEYEYYHVSTYDDVIRGFALDVVGKRLFWVVRKGDGEVNLFRTSSDMTSEDLQYNILGNDIRLGSLKFLHEIDSLMWLPLNSSTITFARTSNPTNEVLIHLSQFTNINCINLRSEYMPANDLSVIPEALDGQSVHISQAFADEWIVKWQPISSSENYTIFYSIIFQFADATNQTEAIRAYKTNDSFIRIAEELPLQPSFHITITASTYWSIGPTTRVQLLTPTTSVAPPRRMRVFVQQFKDPLEASTNISAIVRWDSPESKSPYTEINYKIFCWHGDKLHAEKLYNTTDKESFETTIDGLHMGESYVFQVQSFIPGATKGGQRSSFQILINPELQSKPGFLFSTSEFIAEYDLDLNTYNILTYITSQVEHLAVIPSERLVLWVNENVELLSLTADLKPIKLARMRAEVLSMTVNWVQRRVYWAELETEDKYTISIYELDLCQFEGKVMTPNKIFTLEQAKTVKDLTILPFSNILLWLQFDSKTNISSLMGCVLENSTFITIENIRTQKMFAATLLPELETVSLIDEDGSICTYDIGMHLCTSKEKLVLDNPTAMVKIDRDSSYIYVLKNESIYAYSLQKQNIEYQTNIADIKIIKAYNYQHYPVKKCLLPDHDSLLQNRKLLNPQIIDVGENYMASMLPQVHLIENCSSKIPGLKYTLWITDNGKSSRSHSTFESSLNVTDLMPFTNYTIQLAISSYYQRKLKLDECFSEIITVRTGVGTPSVPRNFTAHAINPSQIYVVWNAPAKPNCEKVWYQLHWQDADSDSGARKRINSMNFLITNLEPSKEYKLWLEVFSAENKYNTTSPVTVKTFETPSRLMLVKKAAYNLTLSWVTSPNVTRTVLICQEVNGENEFSIDITENSSVIVVSDLEPKTKYEFVLEIFYETLVDPYIWPEVPNEYFVYETLGDSPGRPGQPQIEHTIGDVFRIFWQAAPSNGEPITEYSLEALQARSTKRIRRSKLAYEDYMNDSITSHSQSLWAEEPSPIEDKWIVTCNTTDLSCIIREIYILRLLMFRVRARNALYGWGPYSLDSERISEPFVSPEKRDSLVLAIITPAAIVSTFVLILIILRTLHVRRQNAKKLLEKSRPSIWSNISTLQHQQLMASRNRAFSTASHSTLYTGGPLSDADIALLPHIHWSQITILNFLGSGAFGEVYEGLIKYQNCDQEEKVAIKSLRKGASEFAELLQEAQLMSNFKHENIVRLIGICSDTESISIIMEHMEGGDLLSYLRDARPNSKRHIASLNLLDLTSMCIDVCNGCSYLEDMHFVHRDLACRNCLVSSNDPSKRIVKIGDFGLARDIYKSDYYRKEGEGLLPVRWMAPESLIDGVFTTQSDVWAFAVLCWEILSFGQQPYAARNNYEVLNYVKDAGRLEKPENCPDEMFSLLLHCWSAQPDERPSFKKCLLQLIGVKTELRRINLGFSNDNTDSVLYANQPETYLSTFKMNSIPKLKEQDVCNELEDYGKASQDGTNISAQMETFYQDVDIETISDDSQLIDTEMEKNNIHMSSNVNEGISRL